MFAVTRRRHFGWPTKLFQCGAVSFNHQRWVARANLEVAQKEFGRADVDVRRALDIAATAGGDVIVPDIFECLAELARFGGNQEEAARLLGVAAANRDRLLSRRFRVLDAAHEVTVDALRTAMGDNDFDTAWAEGASLSTDDAIAYVQRGRGERKRPASGWASLTPTERDVARLVGEGLGNKDIAARLFVSPRTVESHLTHAYTKLGISSRVQLAQEVGRRTADD